MSLIPNIPEFLSYLVSEGFGGYGPERPKEALYYAVVGGWLAKNFSRRLQAKYMQSRNVFHPFGVVQQIDRTVNLDMFRCVKEMPKLTKNGSFLEGVSTTFGFTRCGMQIPAIDLKARKFQPTQVEFKGIPPFISEKVVSIGHDHITIDKPFVAKPFVGRGFYLSDTLSGIAKLRYPVVPQMILLTLPTIWKKFTENYVNIDKKPNQDKIKFHKNTSTDYD